MYRRYVILIAFIMAGLVVWGNANSHAASIMIVTDRSDLEQGTDGLAGFLRSLGYDVEVSQSPNNASEFQTLDASKIARLESKDLVIIHRATNSGEFDNGPEPSQWNNLNVPLICMSSYLARASRWNWMPGETTKRTGYTDHRLVQPNHPILSGLSANYFTTGRDLDVLDNTATGNGTLIARAPGSGGGAAIVVFPDPAGSTLYFQGTSGETYRQRRTFCALHNYHETGSWSDISENGKVILGRVVQYTMTGTVGLAAPEIVNLSPTNGTVAHPFADGVTFNVTSPQPIAASNIHLILNGADVSLQLDVSGPTTNRAVSFYGLTPNVTYTGHITASNVLGVATLNFGFATFAPDLQPPTIATVDPPAGIVTNLTQITVTFSEPVTGVSFSDLLIDGVQAESLGGSGNIYRFTFAQPAYGPVQILWDIDTHITDLAPTPNVFDPSGPGASWQYTLRDATAPTVLTLGPPAGVMVRQLGQISVLFSEPVQGVDASDLLVNNVPATNVSGTSAGPYVFQFAPPATGQVEVAWAPGNGIGDLATPQNSFSGGAWSYTLDPNYTVPDLRINEFLAATLDTNQLTDEDGELQDWIELYNRGSDTVNLLGWSLTDDRQDPDRWIFPEVTLAPGHYLVVFASAKDRKPTTPGLPLHTNFKLSSAGGFLWLYDAESPRVAVATFDYPEQRSDHSYGYASGDNLRYFATPTPGGPNGDSTILGVVPPVHFSVDHGIFESSFTLVLTCPQASATIRYTTDGSEPSPTRGQGYTGPIQISATTVLRAAAFQTDYLPSTVDTRTYLFLDQVVQQPANPPGFPAGNIWGGYLADYAMDPEITTNAQYQDRMKQALEWLPTMSIVMNVDDLFGTANGIYTHTTSRGPDWERPCSAELLFPDGRKGFQVNCGVQIQGNANRTPSNQPKHSFRLKFKGDYGPAKLEYKMFTDSPVTSFNTLVLRADYNNSWLHWDPDQRLRGQRTRDALMKDTMRAMGGLSSHSRFVNLYVNGLYWGVYDPTERPDEDFASSYLGGTPEDYDVINENVAKAGTMDAYNALLSIGNLSQNSQYEQLQQMLDITNFIDYTLLNFYAANQDWGLAKNWYIIRRRAPGETFKYLVWDGERTFEGPTDNRVSNTDVPGGLHSALLANAEYRLQFADRVHQHFFNGGALTPEAVAARWMKRAAEVDQAMIAESARWGDYRRDVDVRGTAYLYSYFDHFLTEQNRLLTQYFPVRTANVLSQLRGAGLYPNVDAPEFNQHGGQVPSGFNLTMGSTSGTIYFTTNGTDPRLYGSGAVSADALAYNNAVPLDHSMTIKARALSGGTWSALNAATFTVAELIPPLRITEIMYNPIGGDPYEYLELQNIGSLPLDVSGFSFSGITYGFPPNTVLAPGQIVVLANDTSPAAFAARYLGVTPFGYYAGGLSNGGERLSILDANGNTVISVTYDDGNGWPTEADGTGPSLEIIDPAGPPSDPANWQANASQYGTPGEVGLPPTPSPIRLNEVMAENISTITNNGLFSDWVELHNTSTSQVDLSNWSLTDGSDPRRYVFPTDTIIPAGDYLHLWCDTNTSASGLHTGFALKRSGESLFLYNSTTNRVDAISFGPQLADLTIGLVAGQWQLCQPTPGVANTIANVAWPSTLRINEWLANSPPGESDWIELFNTDASLPVALQGLYVGTGNTIFQIHSLSFLGPNSHLQFFANENAGPNDLDFKLPASGGEIALYDAVGRPVDSVSYDAQTEGVSQGRLPDGSSSIVSFPTTPSPGASNYVTSYTGPVLNEVMARNRSAVVGLGGAYPDWIELFNPNGTSVDMTGMRLSDDAGKNDKWTFPAGTRVPGFGYLVVWCDGSRAATTVGSVLNTGFSLSGTSGGVYLFNTLGQPVDKVEYGPQIENLSIGRQSGKWRLLATPTPGTPNGGQATLGSAMNLRVNEWMAAPSSGADWFELYNLDSPPVQVSGLYVSDDPSVAGRTNTQFAPLSFIGGGRWLTLVADGQVSQGGDHVNFSLDAAGETLTLYASDLTVIDSVAFAVQTTDVSQGRLPDGSDTIMNFPSSASPDASNYLPLSNVIINEVLTHTDSPLEDAIELYNPTLNSLDLSGWYLSDSDQDFRKFRFPSGTVLSPDGFLVLYEDQFNGGTGSLVPFTFNSAQGDSAYLSQADASDHLTGYRTSVTFGSAANGVSFGRYPTSVGTQFVAMDHRTFGHDTPADVTDFRLGTGLSNAAALVGPVVIDEIMYHPPDIDASDNAADEFIKLHNRSAADVALYDPGHRENTWQLRQAVDFEFPSNTSIPAGGYLLVVSFDPQADPAALAAFRNVYGITNVVPIVGPYRGKLANSTANLELLRPDTPQQPPHPDAGFVPYILVEQVQYADTAPWPPSADGVGNSLHRILSDSYANDPTNWVASTPTPGWLPPTMSDRDGDGMPDAWEVAHHLNPDDPTDAVLDEDGDGMSNLHEYLAGTDPEDPASTLSLEAVLASGVLLQFTTAPNKSYTIQYRDSLSQDEWFDLINVDAAPAGRVVQVADPDVVKTRFYRIVVQPSL